LPTETFTFLGFPPTRASDRSKWFDELRNAGRTVVFFEAPHRIRQTLEDLLVVIGDCHVAVGRELTKVHEEMVRGPISAVLNAIPGPRGEYTVVLDAGHLAKLENPSALGDAQALREFGELTNLRGQTRRKAITTLARRHNLPAREVYAAVERARRLVK